MREEAALPGPGHFRSGESGRRQAGRGRSRKARHEHEVAERELRAVATREAGRAVACRHFGGVGTTQVWRNSAKAMARGEAAWIGAFKADCEPGAVRYSPETERALGIAPAPANWPCLCRIAGPLAGALAAGITDRAAIESLLAAEAGPADASVWWNSGDVAQVEAVLRSRWQEVEDEIENVVDDFKRSRRGRVMFKD